jgi:eukaryotic-like serine/threonine-protein kinase
MSNPNTESVFAAALAIESAEERAKYLDQAFGADPALRAEVEELLAAFPKIERFLEVPAAGSGVTTDQPSSTVSPGTVIGPYKLIEVIGTGGMGTVYMAQQTEPVKRLVALKLIKPGMDSKQVIARFEAERQALAMMDHPNIAKVLDAGTTAAGQPYFVMEMVKGDPLTTYCDQHRLTPTQRLELFVPVCHAIQHAHQKGVIHRDVKPSNILVALYDGRPVPKVIDFGIAKATGQQLTDLTLVTGFGAVVGTLEYMSPEQAERNQLDIDTRSDIYSLGVLLYELLTGSTPLEKKRLKEAGFLEVLRIIREEEPPRPSTRLSESKDSLPSISAQRQTEPAKLTRLVRGELDWIVMKALDKDRSRRYETANGLAMDVQRYLTDEPVQAFPPSAWYRFQKFVRRNKAAVLATLVFIFLLLAGIAGTTTGWVQALVAEKETSAALLLVSNEQTKTKHALAQVTEEQIRTSIALKQVIAEQVKTQTALASARGALDALTDDVVKAMFVKQIELDEKEKAFLRKVIGFYETVTQQMGQSPEAKYLRAQGIFKVAYLRALLGEQTQAAKEYQQVVELLMPLAHDFPKVADYRESLASSQHNLGILLTDLGNSRDAETAFRHSVAIHEKLAEDFPQKKLFYHGDLAANYVDLGVNLKDQKKNADAEAATQRALELLEPMEAESKPNRAVLQLAARTRSNLGQLFRLGRKLDKAEEFYQKAMEVQRKHVAEFPTAPRFQRDLADSCNGMGIVCAELKKDAAAEKAFREGLALRKKLADDYPKVLQCRHELAGSHRDLGFFWLRLEKFGDAKAEFRKAVEIRRAIVAEAGDIPRYRRELVQSLDMLGNVAWEEQDLNEADAAWREGLTVGEKLVADAPKIHEYHNSLATTLGRLATLQNRKRDFTGAIPLLKKSRSHVDAALAADPKNPIYRQAYRNTLLTLAQCHLGLAEHAQIVPIAEELAKCDTDPPVDALIAAGMLCSCVMLASNDNKLSDEKRTELGRMYTDRALKQVQQAVLRGFRDPMQLRAHPDFRVLQGRKEFQKLLAELDEKNNE